MAMKIVKTRKTVNEAIRLSQINVRMAELRAEMSALKGERDGIIRRLSRKFNAFAFRDSLGRLFHLTLRPRSREDIDGDVVKAICEEAGYEVPYKTVTWVESVVMEVVEE